MSQPKLKKHRVKPAFEAIQDLLAEMPLKIQKGDAEKERHRVHLVLWDAERNCYHSYLSDPVVESIHGNKIKALVRRLCGFIRECQEDGGGGLEDYLKKWIDRNSQNETTKEIVKSWLDEAKKSAYSTSNVDPILPQKGRVEAVQLLLSSIPMYRDFDIVGRFDRLFRNGEKIESSELNWFGVAYDDKTGKVNVYRENRNSPELKGYIEYLESGTELPEGPFSMGIRNDEKGEYFEKYEEVYEYLQGILYSDEFQKSIYLPLYIEGVFYGLVYVPVGDLENKWDNQSEWEKLSEAANRLRKKIDRHLIPLIQSLYEIEFQRRMTDAIAECMSYEELLNAYCRHVNFLSRCTSCFLDDHDTREITVWEREESVPLFYSFKDSDNYNGDEKNLQDIPVEFERGIPDTGTSIIRARTRRVVSNDRQSDREFLQQKNKIRLQQYLRLAQEQFDARMRMLRSGRRAAVAAIMSRNMSHNIGSHVLAKLSSGDDFRDLDLVDPDWKNPVSEFNEFLRTRMDFIADVATSTPAASIPVEIYQDAIAPFAPSQNSGSGGQKLLINHISGVKSLGIDNITIRVVDAEGNEIDENTDRDLPFSSPNGLLGAQALYIIVENIIRNSAKHAYDKSTDDNLEVTIRIQEEVEEATDLLEVNIFDNLDNGSKGLTDKLNGLITDSIIDKDGGLEYEGWGVREMKICAAYLRGVAPEGLDNSHSPALLAADRFGGNLGYRFYLRRPKEAVILDTDARLEPDLPEAGEAQEEECDLETWRDKLRRAGIEHTTDEKILDEAVEHDFLIVVDPNEEVIDMLEDSNSLPLRILIASSDPDASAEDFKGFPVVRSMELDNLKEDFEADQFLVTVREMWYRERHNEERLFLRFDNNTAQATKNRWGDTTYVNVCEEKIKTKDSRSRLKQTAQGHIVLDRHGEFLKCLDIRDDSGTTRTPYEPYNLNNPAVYRLLNGSPEDKLRREKLALEMIEAGATGIAVLDERVQALLEGKTEDFVPVKCFPVLNILNCAGVWVPDKRKRDLDYPKQIDSHSDFFDTEVVENIQSRTKDGGMGFLIVHLGILEKLYKGNNQESEIRKQVNRWEKKGIEVVIISGRGSPPMARKMGTRFLHYSQVAKNLTKDRSKYHLCKALFSSRRLSE